MKKIISIVAILLSVAFLSCGSGSGSENVSTDPATPTTPDVVNSSTTFGITGVSMMIAAKAPTVAFSAKADAEGAYVTWETWIENSIWSLPYQPGSYTAWDIQTPANSGENVSQIVGLAKTCICTDIDNNTGTNNVYYCYYGDSIFYLAVRGTLHNPDGSTYTSEYRQEIPITSEMYNYISYEVMGQNADTFADRMTLSLTYTIEPSSL